MPATTTTQRWTRTHLADLICERLEAASDALESEFSLPDRIPSAILDDLLPPEAVAAIYAAYPAADGMVERKTLREHKLVAAQMDQYDPILEAAVFAFQDPRVVALVGEITQLTALFPDEHLYAGGISRMEAGHFLNPHLDNSHGINREHYRVLNLLYYVSPDWRLANGGNLELWDRGVDQPQRTIESRCNRLVLMQTDRESWHSVSRVATAAARCCVSNYYFSPNPPPSSREYFHVTTFRGRPEEPLKDLALRTDAALRMGIRRLFPKGLGKLWHVYKRPGE